MKKIYIFFSLLLSVGLQSCMDLETTSTTKIPLSKATEDVYSAETLVNGIYRLTYSSWGTENFGQLAIQEMADLMGEDQLMNASGSGWFYYDYTLKSHNDYDTTGGRSYSLWNYYYTLISNANIVISADGTLKGDDGKVNSVLGQAYAIRALSYFYLIQSYQKNYVGNEDAFGVPIYTERTVAGTPGKPRSSVREVYKQINSDIDRSIELLESSSEKEQNHSSHIDYYVANGLKARIALTQHNYAVAEQAATKALSRSSVELANVEERGGNNSYKVKDVLWAMEIISDQATAWASFFMHMDADFPNGNSYAAAARKCISADLYEKLPANDERRAWWRPSLIEDEEENGTSKLSYCQLKFQSSDYKTYGGDYVYMRAEEMVLIQAEAQCQQGKFNEARQSIAKIGNLHQDDYATRLAAFSDDKTYSTDTNADPTTLMDEILFQRRIELWGEYGRLFDLQRLNLGYNRNYTGTNHTYLASNKNTQAGSDLFVLPLPKKEIDGNENLGEDQQNPIIQ